MLVIHKVLDQLAVVLFDFAVSGNCCNQFFAVVVSVAVLALGLGD